jgi:hypothetical protein
MAMRNRFLGLAAAFSWAAAQCLGEDAPAANVDLVLSNVLVSNLAEAVEAAEAEAPKYWIGLFCIEPGEALRAQMNLPEEVGLLVDVVTEDSPAKKAGLQRFDVLLDAKIGDEATSALKDVHQLVDLIQAAKSQKLSLQLLRQGKKQTIEVTPAERPATLGNVELLANALSGEGAEGHPIVMKMHLAGPTITSTLLLDDSKATLPDGMSMEFRQTVGKPERVVVTKGDKTWEVAINELDKLPEDIRKIVSEQVERRQAALKGKLHEAITLAVTGNQAERGEAVKKAVAARAQATAAAAQARAAKQVIRAERKELPKDLGVTIVREGNEPAKVTVKKGDKVYEITEKELDKLPEDLRPVIAPMLNTGANAVWTHKVAAKVAAEQKSVAEKAAADAAQASKQVLEAQKRYEQVVERAIAIKEKAVKDAAAKSEEITKTVLKDTSVQDQKIMKKIAELEEKIEKLVQALEKAGAK